MWIIIVISAIFQFLSAIPLRSRWILDQFDHERFSLRLPPKSLSCLVKSRKAAGVNTNGIPRRDPPPSLFQASAFKWRAFVISSLRASSPSRGHFSVEPLESGSTPLFSRTDYQSIITEEVSFLSTLSTSENSENSISISKIHERDRTFWITREKLLSTRILGW